MMGGGNMPLPIFIIDTYGTEESCKRNIPIRNGTFGQGYER